MSNGKDIGYGQNRGNRHGRGRWNRGGNYNYPYHKNELEYHQQVNRPHISSPIDYPPYPKFVNSQPPNTSFYAPLESPFRQQQHFPGLRPRYHHQSRSYDYERNPSHMKQGVYNPPREYFQPRFNRNRNRRYDRVFQSLGPTRDWHLGELDNYPTPKMPALQSSSDDHSDSWLQQLSQPSMFVSPVAAAPMYPIVPNFQPQSACAPCHSLGSVDVSRQPSLASGFHQSATSVPSRPQSSHPTPGAEFHDIVSMLHQSVDSSFQLPRPKCHEATLCSCPADDTASKDEPSQDDRDKKFVDGRLSDVTSSPTRLIQRPRRAMNFPGTVSSPLRKGIATHQSPLHSLLAQLNLNENANQFQSPERSGFKDDKVDTLLPIGVFWDIENCTVPSGKSAFDVVRRIRERFFDGHREAEFMCVCDIKKENSTVIEELNNAQVTVVHINAVAKNAADEKLKQSLRRFAETHSQRATVILISGDINFAPDIADLRYRHGLKVILVHKSDSSEALKSCANSTVTYTDLIAYLPFRSHGKPTVGESNQLVIHNLPRKRNNTQVKARLEQLSDNCGGKVSHMSNNSAVMKFPNKDSTARAKRRLEGEDVFGSQISVSCQKNGGSLYSNSPRSSRNDNRRSSVLDDSRRSSACQDVEKRKFNGDDISRMNNSQGHTEVSRDERRASPGVMGAESPPSENALRHGRVTTFSVNWTRGNLF